MPKKLFTLPFITLRGKYSDMSPAGSQPGQFTLYFNKEDGKILFSSDGNPYTPLDQSIRDGITIDTDGILLGIGTPGVKVSNSKITIDSSGRIQGIGTPGIKINNDKVFEDPRFICAPAKR